MAQVLELLTWLKEFLADRPEFAALSISLVFNVFMLRKLLKAKDDQIAQAMQLAPLAERLTQMVQKAAARSRSPRTVAPEPASEPKSAVG